jgi:hypothetical protein
MIIESSTISHQIEVTDSSLNIQSGSPIFYSGMNLIEVDQGCLAPAPASCISTLVVSSIPTNVTVTVEVGDNAANQIVLGSTYGLDKIRGDLVINGADVPGRCAGQLLISHTNSQVISAAISNGYVRGIGLANRVITYSVVCSLAIQLGDWDNYVAVLSTHSYPTNISTGSGNDVVYIVSTGGPTGIWTNDGNDTLHMAVESKVNTKLYLDGGLGTDGYNITFAGAGNALIYVNDDSVPPSFDTVLIFVRMPPH